MEGLAILSSSLMERRRSTRCVVGRLPAVASARSPMKVGDGDGIGEVGDGIRRHRLGKVGQGKATEGCGRP